MEQVERLAAWIAKYGPLLGSFDMDLPHPLPQYPGLDEAERTAAFTAVGYALVLAAAFPRGLRLRSCKLAVADWDSARILQQLRVNTLTSLDLDFDFTGPHDTAECVRRLAGVNSALSQLRQLRELSITVDCFHSRSSNLKYVDPLLNADTQPLLGLTNLTSLKLSSLW
jgi:hypothetical protein